jgi:hypothetical protein
MGQRMAPAWRNGRPSPEPVEGAEAKRDRLRWEQQVAADGWERARALTPTRALGDDGRALPDGLGKRPLRKLSGLALVSAAVIDGMPVREVPQRFWSFRAPAAPGLPIVLCPCSVEHVVPLDKPVACDCGRGYLFTGTTVLALNAQGAGTA